MNAADLQYHAIHLLALAKNIRHYESALVEARGERFNIFDILHVGHYEVRTHSPILAEFLNPLGSHGQGAVFLKSFLKEVLNIPDTDFDAESARVSTEVSIGSLGRMDIEIADCKHRRIVIENKIYAGLQEKQLERYHEYDTKAMLLYLTLNKDSPPDGAEKSVGSNLRLVSYRSDIVRWLECCRKEATNTPGVRETITQYIHLIKDLTQQNTSTRMNQELVEAVLKDKEKSYMAYVSLRNANLEIRKAILAKLNAQIEPYICELGLNVLERFSGQGGIEEGYIFTTPELKARNLCFGIVCESSNYNNFFFGFKYISLNSALNTEIVQIFNNAKIAECKSSEWWPAWARWNKHRNLDDEAMAGILSGEFVQDLKALIRELAKVAIEACKSGVVSKST